MISGIVSDALHRRACVVEVEQHADARKALERTSDQSEQHRPRGIRPDRYIR